MRNLIQRELDKAEEYLLKTIFNDIKNPQISNKIKFFMISKNIDFDTYINHKIMIFEEFSQDFMKDDGYYDGKKLTKVLVLKFPILEGLELPDIKPIDLLKILDNFINLKQIGNFIQNF